MPEFTKVAPVAKRFKMEAYIQLLNNFGQNSNLASDHQSWIATITRNHKNGSCHGGRYSITTLYKLWYVINHLGHQSLSEIIKMVPVAQRVQNKARYRFSFNYLPL